MVSIKLVYAIVFFVAMFAVTAGLFWISITDEAHYPASHRSDEESVDDGG